MSSVSSKQSKVLIVKLCSYIKIVRGSNKSARVMMINSMHISDASFTYSSPKIHLLIKLPHIYTQPLCNVCTQTAVTLISILTTSCQQQSQHIAAASIDDAHSELYTHSMYHKNRLCVVNCVALYHMHQALIMFYVVPVLFFYNYYNYLPTLFHHVYVIVSLLSILSFPP